MSAFSLKIIALAAMLIDHVGAVFPGAPFEFRLIGRLTFPIFVYLIAEGFRHTRSPEKFLLRLLAFAIISEPFYDWSMNRAHNIRYGLSPWHVDFLSRTNVFYTLLLGGLSIFVFRYVYNAFTQGINSGINPEASTAQRREAYLAVGAVTALFTLGFMWVADALGTDFGGFGVLFILLMYVVKPAPKWLRLTVMATMCVLLHRWVFQGLWHGTPLPDGFYWFFPATLLSVLLVALYSGKRGPSLKWLFYISYPAHLAILAVLAWVLL